MKFKLFALPLILLWAALAFAASPFNGTWALNQQKSNLTGDTVSFADAGNGAMKFTNSEQTYTFKTDGSQTNTPNGYVVTWKETGPDTYVHTTSLKGKELSASTWKISPDGKKLTIDSHGTKPNGENWQDTEVFERTAGSKGLAGNWKDTKVKLGSPNTLTLAETGNSLKLDISAEKATWQGKMDGQDYPATGPTVPPGLTLAVTRTSPTSFKMVEKIKGKPVFIANYSVNGTTMTTKGTNGEGKEPFTQVWDKRS